MIHIVPILNDNYCYVLQGQNKACVILDPGEAGPVKAFIESQGLRPVLILNTHHHSDHVAGNAALKKLYNIDVTGPKAEAGKIPTLDKGVDENDSVSCAGIDLTVIETPGHTSGHIVFYWKEQSALFSGDTLFSMGCGRLFEGTAADMFASLLKLKSLPDDTNIYCGHEYTQDNATFALNEEPDNADIKMRLAEVLDLRARKLPTLPVTLGMELKTNPFLRAETAKKFAGLRARKDNFKAV